LGAAVCESQWGGPRNIRGRGEWGGSVGAVLAGVGAVVAKWVVEVV